MGSVASVFVLMGKAAMIEVEPTRCAYCGGCVSVCPVDALLLAETSLLVGEACIDCGLCVQACPMGALSQRSGQPAAFAARNDGYEADRSGGQRPEDTSEQGAREFANRCYDLIVVGAGPAGSIAARTAAELGLSVLLLEKRQEIGSPVRCAEGVPHQALADLVQPDPAWISARVEQAQVVAVSGGQVVQQWKGSGGLGYVLERRVFDRALAEQAARAGAEVRVKASAIGLMPWRGGSRRILVQSQGRQVQLESRVVIGADGVESRVGRWAGIDTRLPLVDTMACAQYLLSGIDWDPSCLGYWIDPEIAPGGYAWVFPKGDGRANVGLGVQADLSADAALIRLGRFIEQEPALARGNPVTLVSGVVPVAPPCRQLVADGVMLAGDAARQVDPLTGAGIIAAMTAGRLAAQAAAQAVVAGDTSARRLAPYQERADELLGRRLARNYGLRQRTPPERRASRSFVRLFAVAAGGK